MKVELEQRRGVTIPLAGRSWKLIITALRFGPQALDPEKTLQLANYIEAKLKVSE